MTRAKIHQIKTMQELTIKITQRYWKNGNEQKRKQKKEIGKKYGVVFRSLSKANKYDTGGNK